MDKEVIKIELTAEGRMRLDYQLREGLTKEKYSSSVSFNVLGLGFQLDDDWPFEGEILFSQLVALACKLKMQIIIGDINLSPMIQETKSLNQSDDERVEECLLPHK
jgi:nitrogen regulatory protein PII